MTDYRITPPAGRLESKGYAATLKHIATWWVWNPFYLVIFILATVGSLIFGFVPRWWGAYASAACTIIATVTGFKAGVKYHREIIR